MLRIRTAAAGLIGMLEMPLRSEILERATGIEPVTSSLGIFY